MKSQCKQEDCHTGLEQHEGDFWVSYPFKMFLFCSYFGRPFIFLSRPTVVVVVALQKWGFLSVRECFYPCVWSAALSLCLRVCFFLSVADCVNLSSERAVSESATSATLIFTCCFTRSLSDSLSLSPDAQLSVFMCNGLVNYCSRCAWSAL